ncbi:MAG: DUF6527 family protein [Novosphingobium sp.]|nr:DUF6527 family protein [Novosphingobium sp.]
MVVIKKEGHDKYLFYCPGCRCFHWFTTPRWLWNNNIESPTVTPSIVLNAQDLKQRCHLQIINGRLRYLSDSYHYLAGITISMVDLEEIEEKL